MADEAAVERIEVGAPGTLAAVLAELAGDPTRYILDLSGRSGLALPDDFRAAHADLLALPAALIVTVAGIGPGDIPPPHCWNRVGELHVSWGISSAIYPVHAVPLDAEERRAMRARGGLVPDNTPSPVTIANRCQCVAEAHWDYQCDEVATTHCGMCGRHVCAVCTDDSACSCCQCGEQTANALWRWYTAR